MDSTCLKSLIRGLMSVACLSTTLRVRDFDGNPGDNDSAAAASGRAHRLPATGAFSPQVAFPNSHRAVPDGHESAITPFGGRPGTLTQPQACCQICAIALNAIAQSIEPGAFSADQGTCPWHVCMPKPMHTRSEREDASSGPTRPQWKAR